MRQLTENQTKLLATLSTKAALVRKGSEWMRMMEISEKSGVHPSTTFQGLRALRHYGYAESVQRRRLEGGRPYRLWRINEEGRRLLLRMRQERDLERGSRR